MGRKTALFNNRGMSLIEIMIALVILLIVSLALLQTALLGIQTNLKNSLRDEAVNIADMRLSQLTSLPFTDAQLNAGSASETVSRTIRAAAVSYSLTRTITSINANTKQITMSVSWPHKGQTHTHNITTIMRNQ